MEIDNLDAIVVGGGPAGSMAAARMAAAGARVVIVEKDAVPRYKTCGGGVVGRAMRWAAPAVMASAEAQAHVARLTFSDMSREYELQDEAPLVHLVMRDRLDQELLQSAARHGAQVLEPCSVSGAQRVGARWYLDTSRGPLQAPIVVAADGANSRMARAAGWRQLGRRAAALEWEIAVDDASLQRTAHEVRFDFDCSLQGYAWVFPKRQRLSVGILSTRRGGGDLKSALSHYLRQRQLHPKSVETHAWMIPIEPRSAILAQNGVFLVGDAAGLVDPITCEGISAALWSGDLVGRCLQQAAFEPEQAMRLYQNALRAEVLPELRWARRLARVLYGPRSLRRFLFDHYGEVFCAAMGSVISGRHTYRSLLSQPGHWRQLWTGRAGRSPRIDVEANAG